jgi:hypothetical protein
MLTTVLFNIKGDSLKTGEESNAQAVLNTSSNAYCLTGVS